MEELRKNNILQIELNDGTKISGIVSDYQKDRVMVTIDDVSIEDAKKLNELDDICVSANTPSGIKKMNSCIIYSLYNNNCIVIENNPSEEVVQKRNCVRAVDDFDFILLYNNNSYNCKCLNISVQGIAFNCEYKELNISDKAEIVFADEIFGKEITCNSEIIKKNGDFIVAKFINMNEYDENKIVKRIYRILTKK